MFSMLTSGGMVLFGMLTSGGIVLFSMLTSGEMVLCLACLPQVGWCYV
jgi:hypothetical protein